MHGGSHKGNDEYVPCMLSPLAGASKQAGKSLQVSWILKPSDSDQRLLRENIALDEVPKEVASARVVNDPESAGVVIRGLRIAGVQRVLRGRHQGGFGAGSEP